MNIIVVNGSAKRGGECEKLINMFNEGVGAKVIDVFWEEISPCVDCGLCKGQGRCVIEDDMQKHYAEIEAADFIVFASPVYFSSLTGIMMNFLSRFQLYFLNGELVKNKRNKKKAFLLLTGGGATKTLSLAEHQLKLALREIGGELCETVAYMQTDKESVIYSEETIKKIEDIKEKYGLNMQL